MDQRRPLLTVSLFLLLATFVLYGQVLDHEFVHYDDDVYVTENPRVQAGLSIAGLRWAFTSRISGHWQPLTVLSHMLDCELFGLNPRGHHFTSLLLHAANTLLLFLLLRGMTGALWRSAFVAAVFALHPLHVESVAWVADRKDLLGALFWILTLGAYAGYARRPAAWRYLLVLLAYAAGLMAKPNLVTLPLLLLLLDYWPLGRLGPETSGRTAAPHEQGPPGGGISAAGPRGILLEKVPLLLLALASGLAALIAMKGVPSLEGLERSRLIPGAERILNAPISYVIYLWRTIWPLNLAVIYPHAETIPPAQAAGAACLLLALSWFVLRSAKPYLVVGWLWYLIGLLPVVGLLKAGPWAPADRYLYMPLLGPLFMLAWGWTDLQSRWRHGKGLSAVAAGLMLSALSLLAWLQTGHWRDSISLFEHAIQVTAGNFKAHNNLGNALAWQGRPQEAIEHYEASLSIRPDFAEAHNNLGFVLAEQGKTQEAVAHYAQALGIKPDYAEAHNNLGNALARQGDLKEAIDHYRRAIGLRPDYAEAHNNLGNALARQGGLRDAERCYRSALGFKPDYAEAHSNLGSALALQGRMEEAADHYARALALRPDYAEAHYALGNLLARQERIDEAMAHYREALRRRPDHAEARFKLGKALSFRGMLGEALEHFIAAVRVRPDHAEAHLAIGLAALGQGRWEMALEAHTLLSSLDPGLAQILQAEIRKAEGRRRKEH